METPKKKLPPNRLRGFQHANPISPGAKAKLAMAAPADSLPVNFSWANSADVQKALPGSNFVIARPVDQELCGNCWACSIALSLTDRVAISRAKKENGFDGTKEDSFSISWMTACNEFCDGSEDKCTSGCDGADIGTALKFLSLGITNGVPYETCLPIKKQPELEAWREKFTKELKQCQFKGGSDFSNECLSKQSMCASCSDTTKGSDNPNFKDTGVFVNADTIHKIDEENTIKQDIYLHGPVPAGFQVFPDFADTNIPPYEKTGNVYITHMEKSTPEEFHAVSIVGWGEKLVTLDGTPTTVKFWVVRNSWGTGWGDRGFWNHAIRDTKLGINKEAGMEGNSNNFGGVVSFLPEIRTVKKRDNVPKVTATTPPEVVSNTPEVVSNTPVVSPTASVFSSENIIIFCFAIVIVLLVVYYVYYYKDNKQNSNYGQYPIMENPR